MNETLAVLVDALPYVLQGAVVTCVAVVGAMFLGLCIGVPLAVGQVYGGRVARMTCGLYIWFFGACPFWCCSFFFTLGSLRCWALISMQLPQQPSCWA